MYAHLPAWLAVFVEGLVPAAAAALAGYLKNDPLRISEDDLPDPSDYVARHAETDGDGDAVYADGADEPDTSEPDTVSADAEPADYRPGA